MPLPGTAMPFVTPSAGAGQVYVDRGDPAAPDLDVTDFPAVDAWTDISLASIVPIIAANRLVHILYWGKHPLSGSMQFRQKGRSSPYNTLSCWSVNATYYSVIHGLVLCDASRKIQYNQHLACTVAVFIVRGWFVDG